jgi:hypothetical protein
VFSFLSIALVLSSVGLLGTRSVFLLFFQPNIVSGVLRDFDIHLVELLWRVLRSQIFLMVQIQQELNTLFTVMTSVQDPRGRGFLKNALPISGLLQVSFSKTMFFVGLSFSLLIETLQTST